MTQRASSSTRPPTSIAMGGIRISSETIERQLSFVVLKHACVDLKSPKTSNARSFTRVSSLVEIVVVRSVLWSFGHSVIRSVGPVIIRSVDHSCIHSVTLDDATTARRRARDAARDRSRCISHHLSRASSQRPRRRARGDRAWMTFVKSWNARERSVKAMFDARARASRDDVDGVARAIDGKKTSALMMLCERERRKVESVAPERVLSALKAVNGLGTRRDSDIGSGVKTPALAGAKRAEPAAVITPPSARALNAEQLQRMERNKEEAMRRRIKRLEEENAALNGTAAKATTVTGSECQPSTSTSTASELLRSSEKAGMKTKNKLKFATTSAVKNARSLSEDFARVETLRSVPLPPPPKVCRISLNETRDGLMYHGLAFKQTPAHEVLKSFGAQWNRQKGMDSAWILKPAHAYQKFKSELERNGYDIVDDISSQISVHKRTIESTTALLHEKRSNFPQRTIQDTFDPAKTYCGGLSERELESIVENFLYFTRMPLNEVSLQNVTEKMMRDSGSVDIDFSGEQELLRRILSRVVPHASMFTVRSDTVKSAAPRIEARTIIDSEERDFDQHEFYSLVTDSEGEGEEREEPKLFEELPHPSAPEARVNAVYRNSAHDEALRVWAFEERDLSIALEEAKISLRQLEDAIKPPLASSNVKKRRVAPSRAPAKYAVISGGDEGFGAGPIAWEGAGTVSFGYM